jgi:hypothetical protein
MGREGDGGERERFIFFLAPADMTHMSAMSGGALRLAQRESFVGEEEIMGWTGPEEL